MNTAIRPAAVADLRLITDSWCKSYLGQSRQRPRGCGPLSHMDRTTYFQRQTAVIRRLIARETSQTGVLHPEEDPEMVLGWICGEAEPRLLHFVYVGGLYRQEGYGGRLLHYLFDFGDGFPPITITHWTRAVPHYLKRWNLRYDPYATETR